MNTKKKNLVFAVLALLLLGLSTASVSANPVPACPGTGTPGYWKNHPEVWADFDEWEYFGLPDDTTQDDVIEMLESRGKDKTYTLFKAVLAAKFNYHAGNTGDCWCVGTNFWKAREWLKENTVGSGVKASSKEWKEAEPWYLELDDYNNGKLCAPSRE